MKFNFGEKVKIKDSGEIFTITHVRLIFPEIGLQYWGDYSSYTSKVYAENELELYQEPKTKKLFAYRNFYSGEWIHFSEDPNNKQSNYRRMPDFDIEYPSEEVK